MTTYIVQLKDGYSRESLLPFCQKVGKPEHIQDIVIVEVTDEQADTLLTLDFVLNAEQDVQFTPTDYKERNIGNYALPSLNHYKKPNTYLYNRTGKGVNLVVIDSGVRDTHEDFPPVTTLFEQIKGQTWDQDNVLKINRRHGTICASAAYSKKYGVAPEVNAYSCFTNFSHSSIIKSYDMVIGLHKSGDCPTVVSMSYMAATAGRDRAVQAMCDSGIVCIAAAGNWNEDLSVIPRWPAVNPYVFGVGALTEQMSKASFSSYGTPVEIWAAGQNVLVATITSDTGTSLASGTSLACPYVAGVMALFLEGSDKPTSLSDVVDIRERFLSESTKRVNGKNTVYSLVDNQPFKSKLTRFIERFYTICLERNAEEAGMSWWKEVLLSGQHSGGDVSNGFFNSNEYINKHDSDTIYINKLYKVMFDRIPAQVEVDWHLETMSRLTRNQVLDNFTHSPEFARMCDQYQVRPL